MNDPVIVQAPRHYSITIVGSVDAVRSRNAVNRHALAYLLDRLFSGERVSEAELAMFGFRIHIEWDSDAWPFTGPALGGTGLVQSGGKP